MASVIGLAIFFLVLFVLSPELMIFALLIRDISSTPSFAGRCDTRARMQGWRGADGGALQCQYRSITSRLGATGEQQ